MKKIYMYLLDTMADWEQGYLLQGLTLQGMKETSSFELVTVGISKEPVTTAGGLKIIPDICVNEMVEEQAAALVLIGADTWMEDQHQPILKRAASFLETGKTVAAICGATLGLAKQGILNRYQHTSNALFYLQSIDTYNGSSYYIDKVAVIDQNLITASSAGSLLWAKYIMENLKLYSAQTLDAWYHYFSTGQVEYFEKLMASINEENQ